MFYQFGKKENIRDRMFMILTLLCTFIPLVVAAGFFILLGGNSSEAFRTFGFKFILSTQWDPVQQLYGAFPAISGTLVTTVIHFQQCMYQGLWVEDSPLKQLPFFEDRVWEEGGVEE